MSELYTLSWSKKNHRFHIESLSHLLARNRRAYTNDSALSDYHVIHVGPRQECEQAADAARNTLVARGMAGEAISRAMEKARP